MRLQASTRTPTDAAVHPHVNIYCNGERKLSLGYDPTTATPTVFPKLTKAFDEIALFFDKHLGR